MAITRTKVKKADVRQPNFQPNDHPELLLVEVSFNGTPWGSLALTQAAKLSEKGNVTYNGLVGSSLGLTLPGDPSDALALITMKVAPARIGQDDDGNPVAIPVAAPVDLTVAESGVHQSDKGNPTVCHTAAVNMPGEVPKYMTQVYATFVKDVGSFSLSGSGFKQGSSGKAIIGLVSGFTFQVPAE